MSHRACIEFNSFGGGATSSGLRVGDVLLAVDGLQAAGLLSQVVYDLMIDRDVGATAKLTVERKGVERTFEVVVEPEIRQAEDH